MKRILIAAFFCGAAFAQNSDLGLLLGVGNVRTRTIAGHTETQVSAHGQINYAVQVKELPSGRLYVELPFLFGGQVHASMNGGVSSSAGSIVYFTPGVRWNVPVHDRLAVYATAGAGLAGFTGNRVEIGKGWINTNSGFDSAFAGAVGGGLDVRLSRLMSLRMEARDFITRSGMAVEGHNHVVIGFGVGFHW